MWIKVKSDKQCVFYNPNEIEEFGKYDTARGGLYVTIKGEKEKVFLNMSELDELYAQGDIKMDLRLLQAGYPPQATRKVDAESLRSFIED